MYRKAYLFALIASALIDTTGTVLGQTPNLRAWGFNGDGELGNGVDRLTVSRSVPGQVTGLTGVAAVAGGEIHSLALKGDGTVWAWGNNGEGELGNRGNANRSDPAEASGRPTVVAVAVGCRNSLPLRRHEPV